MGDGESTMAVGGSLLLLLLLLAFVRLWTSSCLALGVDLVRRHRYHYPLSDTDCIGGQGRAWRNGT